MLSCAAQVEPASENEQLRKREAVLKRCVETLSETHDQWIAAAEVEPPSLGGGASSPARAAELDLPPLPLLGEQLAKLQGVAALHADQVELTLRRVSAMCDESALQRKQLSSSAHQASFSGCAARPPPLEPPACAAPTPCTRGTRTHARLRRAPGAQVRERQRAQAAHPQPGVPIEAAALAVGHEHARAQRLGLACDSCMRLFRACVFRSSFSLRRSATSFDLCMGTGVR